MGVALFFLIWRFVDLFISFISPRFIPYLGFFPYKELLVQYRLPDFISRLASFDGVHYTQIADNGYAQGEQAFFPLYPLLIKIVTYLTHNRLLSGLLISNICFCIGLYVLKKYFQEIKNERMFYWVILFLLAFPSSFFFGVVYNEGLFFLLFISSLFFMKKKQYTVAAFFAVLSSLTRLVGVFLIIPFFFQFVSPQELLKKRVKIHRIFWPLIVSPFIGLVVYCIYLWRTTGDPLYFFNVQPSFGANRSTHLILLPQVYFRYFKIFVTARPTFQYFVSLLECILFTFIFTLLVLDLTKQIKKQAMDRVALNLFSFANLILPTLTGTFSSITRYSLLSLSAFLFLGEIKKRWIKICIVTLFVILHILLLGFFVQGYFVG